MLEECYDRGGWFYGLFDDDRLIGVAVLESRFIGQPRDQLQLKFLHVGNGYRDQGLGRRLFELAATEARREDFATHNPGDRAEGRCVGLTTIGCRCTLD